MQTDYEKFLSKELSNANRERIIRKHFITLHEKLLSIEEEIDKLTYCDIKLEIRKISENKDDPSNGKIHFQNLKWEKNNNGVKIHDH